jgi:hypothetical protein
MEYGDVDRIVLAEDNHLVAFVNIVMKIHVP